MSILGRPITNKASCPTARVEAHGHSSKTVTGAKYGSIKLLHDLPVDMLSKWLRRAKIPQTGGAGGFERT